MPNRSKAPDVTVREVGPRDGLQMAKATMPTEAKLRWVGRTDYANLKLKVATAIVAISSIHLLQVFMKVESYSREGVMWRLGIHALFVLGALLLGLLDRITRHGKAEENESV